ncbi:hypothetical protein COCSADRAFT_164400 [Bipolaris sorokiniana ND90Pr]|uniref:LysM domain-containing protein n=1 Tax=Cochliobolus sativus (strain ND90Pr / ATCC 201652) TaxID=665912 RepID=M2RWP2_COCSN|nr:uncharacterized protein COCSADRAFT_164400 [Bipolaris sorokiniana ND90Pr]EMD59493.1 hypothetical protein COCSADRAFT_164400 [Bipolaris sorokiniana ND90Pr]
MEQECFLCQLDTQAKQLGSPSGYDEQAASDCASITSGCAATNLSGPVCNTGRNYTIQDGDLCNSIAEAQGVSTPALINLTNIDAGYDGIPPVELKHTLRQMVLCQRKAVLARPSWSRSPAEPTQESVPSFAPSALNSRVPDTVNYCDTYMSPWPQDIIVATPECNSCDY